MLRTLTNCIKRRVGSMLGCTALFALCMVIGAWAPASAASTWYVDHEQNGDGTTEESALPSIQAAISKAQAGDIIMVAPGVYSPIQTANKAIQIVSMAGAELTIIDGGGTRRCATLSQAAVAATPTEINTQLDGFTLRNGNAAGDVQPLDGGAVLGGTVMNCVIESSKAQRYGGGAAGALISDSIVRSNTVTSVSNGQGLGGGVAYCTVSGTEVLGNTAAISGGGAYSSTLAKSTVTLNTARDNGGGAFYGALTMCLISENKLTNVNTYGGGARDATLVECVMFGNRAAYGGAVYGGTLAQSTVVANKSTRTAANSGAGVMHVACSNTIIWDNTLANGAVENYYGGTYAYCCTFPLVGGAGNIRANPFFLDPATHDYQLMPDSPCIDMGDDASIPAGVTEDFNGAERRNFDHVDIGAFEAMEVQPPQPVRYVNQATGDDANLGLSADDAKATIQAAVNSLVDRNELVGEIHVAAGTYAPFTVDNRKYRIVATEGADKTFVDGKGATRCATLATSATTQGTVQTSTTLVGFTLMNGNASAVGLIDRNSAGAVLGGTLMGCRIINSTATYYGGGVGGAILADCVVTNNTTTSASNPYGGAGVAYCSVDRSVLAYNKGGYVGGGALHSTVGQSQIMNNQSLNGGGAYGGTLTQCTISGNTATSTVAGTGGGGAHSSVVRQCLVTANSASYGGGTLNGEAVHSTIVANTSIRSAANSGAGVYGSACRNTIIWNNTLTGGVLENYSGGSYTYCCTTPLAGGAGNINSDPFFVEAAAGNYRLQSYSPCVDAGNDALMLACLAVDFDGNPRHVGLRTDMGIFESATTSAIEAVRYVDNAAGNDTNDGLAWATAKKTLQSGIDSVLEMHGSGTVKVKPGTYAPITVANRAVFIEAVQGPSVTFIDGGSTRRCATLGTSLPGTPTETLTTLSGFTLTHGNANSEAIQRYNAGGVLGGTLTNCVVTLNTANYYGGGAGSAVLMDCTLDRNSSTVGNVNNQYGGGGAVNSTLTRCRVTGNTSVWLGGGLFQGTASDCVISGNSVTGNGGGGGGAYNATLFNCTVSGNAVTVGSYGGGVHSGSTIQCIVTGNTGGYGGAMYGGAMYNSTVVGNRVLRTAINSGAGVYSVTVYNSIILDNKLNNGIGNVENYVASSIYNTCTSPAVGGVAGDLSVFVNAAAGDYHLVPGSVCIDAGRADLLPVNVATDFAGNARVQGLCVDMGVYESGETFTSSNVRWVKQNGGNDADDGLTESTAFATISKAITSLGSTADAQIWVGPGTYEPITLTGNKRFKIESTAGAATTSISGGGAHRCATLASGIALGENNTVLKGFTLTAGFADTKNDPVQNYGGGVLGGTLINCVITGNSAKNQGGGAGGSVLINCTVFNNTQSGGANDDSTGGGGAAFCMLTDCTVSGNSAGARGAGVFKSKAVNSTITANVIVTANNGYGAGAYGGELTRCIITKNTHATLNGNSSGGGVHGATVYGCLIAENKAGYGAGVRDSTVYQSTIVKNTSFRSGTGSGAGTYGGTCYNTIVWENRLSAGVLENCYSTGLNTCSVLPSGSTVAADPYFVDADAGDYHLQPYSSCVDAGNNANLTAGLNIDLDGQPRIQLARVDIGAYEATEFQASEPVRYVDIATGKDTNDGLSWKTAKKTLQAGIDSLLSMETTGKVYVKPGTYAPITAANKDIRIESTGGASVTIIDGGWNHVDNNGSRCATLSSAGASDTAQTLTVLQGFTLINGNANASGNTIVRYQAGGALGGTLIDCVIKNCQASYYAGGAGGAILIDSIIENCKTTDTSNGHGGGAAWCTMTGCTIRNNSSQTHGGGVYGGTLVNCTISGNSGAYGGGVRDAVLYNCVISGNSTSRVHNGGGAYGGSLYQCKLIGNTSSYGGGTYNSTLVQCLVVNNASTRSSTGSSGGTYGGTIQNTIVWGNKLSNGALENYVGGAFNNSCTYPNPGGNNIGANPLFVDAATQNYHLQPYSPCIDAGSNAYLPADLLTDWDGAQRIQLAVVDIGPYESATQEDTPAIRYVDYTTGDDLNEGISWDEPKKSIQGALDSLFTRERSGTVYVKPGTYGIIRTDNKRVRIESTGGANVTFIDGGNARRCATLGTYLAGSPVQTLSILQGFTLVNGNASSYGREVARHFGGAVLGGTLIDCVIKDSTTFYVGGGAASSVLVGCVVENNRVTNADVYNASYGNGGGLMYCTATDTIIRNNRARRSGNGAYASTLTQCQVIGNRNINVDNAGYKPGSNTYGAGTCNSTLTRCTLSGNYGTYYGGGNYGGRVINCLITGNSARYGAGNAGGTMYNSTVADNTSIHVKANVVGSGVYATTCYNTIIWNNKLSTGVLDNQWASGFAYSCILPAMGGVGNLATDPLFTKAAVGNYHLATNSPCIDAGNSAYVPATLLLDLDNTPRIQLGRPDMGAYEIPASEIILPDNILLADVLYTTISSQIIGSYTLARNLPNIGSIPVDVTVITTTYPGHLYNGRIYLDGALPVAWAGLTGQDLKVVIDKSITKQGLVNIEPSPFDEIPGGGRINADKSITLPGLDNILGTDDDITIASIDGTLVPTYDPTYGYVTVPANDHALGGVDKDVIIVKESDGLQLAIPAGSRITPNGIIAIGETTVDAETGKIHVAPGGFIYVYMPPARLIVGPVEEPGATIDPSLPAVIIEPNGPVITIPDGAEIDPEDPEDPFTGRIVLPGNDKKIGTKDDLTLPSATYANGYYLVNETPAKGGKKGNKVLVDIHGVEVVVPAGSIISANGVVMIGSETTQPVFNNDDHNTVSVPEGGAIYIYMPPMVKILDGPATYDPTVPQVVDPENPDDPPVVIPDDLEIIPGGGRLNDDYSITLPGLDGILDTDDDVTILAKAENTYPDYDSFGNVTVPANNAANGGTGHVAIVKESDSSQLNIPAGTLITPNGIIALGTTEVRADGTIHVEPGGAVYVYLPPARLIVDPVDEPGVIIDPEGPAVIIEPSGPTIIIPDGPEIIPEEPEDPYTGKITLPGYDGKIGTKDDLTIPNGTYVNGYYIVSETPVKGGKAGKKVLVDIYGVEVEVPAGSFITASGIVLVGNGVESPAFTGDAHYSASVPEGGAIYTYMPPMVKVIDGPATFDPTLPGVTEPEEVVIPEDLEIIPGGGRLNDDYSITLPGLDGKLDTDDDVTILAKAENTYPDYDSFGNVTVPANNAANGGTGHVAIVKESDGSQLNIPAGSRVTPNGIIAIGTTEVRADGTIHVDAGGAVYVYLPPARLIVDPVEEPGDIIDPEGPAVIIEPSGPAITIPDGIIIDPEDPEDPFTGRIVLPGNDKKTGTKDDLTLPSATYTNGYYLVNETPAKGGKKGNKVLVDIHGVEVEVPVGSLITANGVVLIGNGTESPAFNNDGNNTVSVPEGGAIYVYMPPMVKVVDGPATFDPTLPGVTEPEEILIPEDLPIIPGGGRLNDDYSITLPGLDGILDTDDDVTILAKAENTYPDYDSFGNVTVPANNAANGGTEHVTIVKESDGSQLNIPAGSRVTPNGIIALGDSVVNADGTIHVEPGGAVYVYLPPARLIVDPVEEPGVIIDPEGPVVIIEPTGPIIIIPDGTVIDPEDPEDPFTGRIVLPGNDKKTGTKDDLTLPNATYTNGYYLVNETPAKGGKNGNKVLVDIHGVEVDVPAGSLITANGVVLIGNGIESPAFNNDGNNTVSVPEGGAIYVYMPPMVKVVDGPATFDPTLPGVTEPEEIIIPEDLPIIPGGGRLNDDYSITLPGLDGLLDTDDDVTILRKAPGAYPDYDSFGNVTVPANNAANGGTGHVTIVKESDGSQLNIPAGSRVTPNGIIALGNSVVNADGTIHVEPGGAVYVYLPPARLIVDPVEEPGVIIDPEGPAVIIEPSGPTIIIPDGTEIDPEDPEDPYTGRIIIPGQDGTPGTWDDLVIPNGTYSNGYYIVNETPVMGGNEGEKVLVDIYGNEVVVPAGSFITADGTVLIGNGSESPTFNDDVNNTVSVPEGGAIYVYMPPMVKVIDGPAIYDPTLPGVFDPEDPEDPILIPEDLPIIPGGGRINDDGSITLPGLDGSLDTDDDITIMRDLHDGTMPQYNAYGYVTVPLHPELWGGIYPSGKTTIVKESDGQSLLIYPGSIITPNGIIALGVNLDAETDPGKIKAPEGGSIYVYMPPARLIIHPLPPGSVIDPQIPSVIVEPDGPTIIIPDGIEIIPEDRDDPYTGKVTLPGNDGKLGTADDLTIPSATYEGSGYFRVNEGSVMGGEDADVGLVEIINGEYASVVVPAGSLITKDGITLIGDNLTINKDKNHTVDIPEGGIVYVYMPPMVRVTEGPATFDPSGPSVIIDGEPPVVINIPDDVVIPELDEIEPPVITNIQINGTKIVITVDNLKNGINYAIYGHEELDLSQFVSKHEISFSYVHDSADGTSHDFIIDHPGTEAHFFHAVGSK